MDICLTEVTDKAMISIEKLNKYYGKTHILQDVTVKFNKGEIYGLLGPNGAGKSTLLTILATISSFQSGNITIKEYDLRRNTKKVRELIGYVPQDIALWEHLSVKDNFLFWSKFTKEKVQEEYLYELCQTVQLKDKWDVKVSQLSGGMKRKLNIAVSLIHKPDILLMDEPTVGIDIQSKIEINDYIRRLALQGKTIVYTTHDISEILSLCDRVGVLKKGVFQFSGTLRDARQFLQHQGHPLLDDQQLIYTLLN